MIEKLQINSLFEPLYDDLFEVCLLSGDLFVEATSLGPLQLPQDEFFQAGV